MHDLARIRAYDEKHFGRTAEDRLGELARKGKVGPAEGEPGVNRVESYTSNGVQVRTNKCNKKKSRKLAVLENWIPGVFCSRWPYFLSVVTWAY